MVDPEYGDVSGSNTGSACSAKSNYSDCGSREINKEKGRLLGYCNSYVILISIPNVKEITLPLPKTCLLKFFIINHLNLNKWHLPCKPISQYQNTIIKQHWTLLVTMKIIRAKLSLLNWVPSHCIHSAMLRLATVVMVLDVSTITILVYCVTEYISSSWVHGSSYTF